MNAHADAHERFTPLILAAGRGERMGKKPKALLDVAGHCALERCLLACFGASLRTTLAPPVVVLGHGGMHAAAHASALPVVAHPFELAAGSASTAASADPSIADRSWKPSFVTNPAPDRGQTSSVQTALATAPHLAGFLIWPVDHPLVESDDVAALVEAARQAPQAPVVLPSHDGRAGHPALVRAALRAEIVALPADDPLHDVLRPRRADTVFVVRDNAGVVIDIDTPADLDAALQHLSARAGARR